jgi:outer membrane protein TolC
LKYISPADLKSFGLIPELIGRLPVLTYLKPLDAESLRRILTEPKNALIKQYEKLFEIDGVKLSFEKNLNRADTFRRIVNAKVLSGIIPGVDSSQANAEYSSAKIVLTKSIDQEAVLSNQLFQLIGIDPQAYILDSFFINRIPKLSEDSVVFEKHPLLQFYRSRINVSDVQSKFIRKSAYPVFAMVGVFQGRGSGFNSAYLFDPLDFTKNYWSGTTPTRVNYLLGVGLTWNIIQPFRISQQVKSQNLISKGLQEEYVLANQQIAAQLKLADIKLKNALLIYNEVPIQIKAATDAYVQKSVLYKNGLTNLVDLTQILYVLIRAETDRDIAYNNVWQALLSKAASAGDFSIFENQF